MDLESIYRVFIGRISRILSYQRGYFWANLSRQNNPFRYKVDQFEKDIQYRNREYQYDSLGAQLVVNESTWSSNHIKNRSLEILDFIMFKLDEDQNKLSIKEKVALLGLNFLSENLEQLGEANNVEYQ